MERKELYALIKEFGLQQEIQNTFGTNYTRVPNADLETIVRKHLATPATTAPVGSKENTQTTTTDNPFEAAAMLFLGILKDAGLLEELIKKL